MELLQKALNEALTRNTTEADRWTKHKEDHLQAKENLDRFRKSISIDIMVPIGSKALIPGKLYHTNEVFISHSQSMYSKCTAHQAMEICNHRIKKAEQRLEALNTEHDMYQNKVDLPFAEDAFSSEGQHDIIEECTVEEDLKWRQEHEQKVKAAKEIERNEREDAAKEDRSIKDVFEELELIEELDEELERLNVEDDDALDKLLKGEMPVPVEKKRISHATAKTETINPEKKIINIVPRTSLLSSLTNNNNQSNNIDFDNTDSDDSISEDSDDEPVEFKLYKQEAANMSNSEKLQFFKKHLNLVQADLETTHAATFEEFIVKTDKLFLSEHILNEIDRIRDRINDDQEVEEALNKTKVTLRLTDIDEKKAKSGRTVSFASEDDVASFCKYEEPRKVSIENITGKQTSSGSSEKIKIVDEKNVTDETVTLSKEQLVEKERVKEYVLKMADLNLDEVAKLMNDIYKEKEKTNENEAQLPADRVSDPSKSILKNKDAVSRETHLNKNATIVEKEETEEESRDTSKPLQEFNKIMGDIFEKMYPPTTAKTNQPVSLQAIQPDPLPEETHRDSHAPKQRISKFKASRQK